MAYKGRYINPLKQHGKKTYTLLLEDPTGVMPPIRIDKKFDEKSSDDDLHKEAEREVLRAVFPEVTTIDKAEGT